MKPSPSPFLTHEPTEPDIQRQAYHLWIDGGCLEGVEVDNWFVAKELLRHRQGHAHGQAIRGAHAVTQPSTQARS